MAEFSIGDKLRLTLFGQSHGPAIGCVIDGFPAGVWIDWNRVNAFMARRAPGQNAWSTARREADAPEILSGLDEKGRTCGAPIAALIRNTDSHSADYPDLTVTPRPGHADFAADIKYRGAWDVRGGGHFSARLTAPLCFAGALCAQWLENPGIPGIGPVRVAAHIARIGGVTDESPDPVSPRLPFYAQGAFPVVDSAKGEEMKKEIEAARQRGDSVDGAVKCFAVGVPAGLGGPWFGGLEGKLAQALFAIPAVKGVAFGDTRSFGSENNDPYCLREGKACTRTNHCGGILGGISNGMPLWFTVSFKPTPSISLPQQTLNLKEAKETTLHLKGRHDPCVVPRAVPVVEAAAALVLTDLMLQGA